MAGDTLNQPISQLLGIKGVCHHAQLINIFKRNQMLFYPHDFFWLLKINPVL